MKKKLVLNREVLRRLDEEQQEAAKGGITCTCLCTRGNTLYVECQPGYTCGPGCIPF